MLNDQAIFLHKVKYGDSGLVVKLLTQKEGKRSFLIQGLKGKNKSVPAMLYPLAQLEIEGSTGRGGLSRLRNIQVSFPLHEIRNDLQKSGLAYFLAEVLLKSVPEGENQPELFRFVELSSKLLDGTSKMGNFHLVFLCKLSQLLGFGPLGSYSGREFFDLQEGLFTRLRPSHTDYFEQLESKLLSEIVTEGFEFLDQQINRRERRVLLEGLIKYFQIHIESFGGIKSLEVLRQLNE